MLVQVAKGVQGRSRGSAGRLGGSRSGGAGEAGRALHELPALDREWPS